MDRTVICISHATGAGGPELGRLVANELGLRFVDEEIITRAAEQEHVTTEELADAERRKSLLSRILREFAVGAAAMGPAGIPAVVGPIDFQADKGSLRDLIRQSVNETADEGRVVIVSHAASYALGDRENVLRVLVTASPEVRTRRLIEAGLDEKEAAKSISSNDLGRSAYLKRFYGVANELPTHYDVVVNTDRFSVAQGAELVVHATHL
jgi:CMP/dCMP kinase